MSAAPKTPAKTGARVVREAVAQALFAATGEDRFSEARTALEAAPIDDADRLRALDLVDAVTLRARLLEQLLGNALASAFSEAEGDALDRRPLRALALPLLAELTGPRRTPTKQLVESYRAVARTLPDAPKDEDVDRALTQLAREVALMKSTARLAAVQALYQMEMAGQTIDKVREQFESLRIGAEIDGERYREADIDLFRAILNDVLERQAAVDQLTDRTLVDRWPLGRVDATLRAIFRAAGAELLAAPKTPPKVVISEYVDVARAFWPEGKEPGLVNAVLDAMAREARPEAFA